VILLDTHVWVWWVHQDDRLSTKADQIIVATARHHGCELVTMDQRILSYPHVPLARVD
jgi:PIN domain nuclease of toxin-antitoxin system